MTQNFQNIIQESMQDCKTVGEAANEKKIVTPREGIPFKSIPLLSDELQAAVDAANVAQANLQNAINVALAAGAGEAGWISSLVVDASGENQQQINDKTVQYVSQLSDLSNLQIRRNGMIAIVSALDGRVFVYDSTQANVNNGITIIDGWVLKSPDKIYFPEWAGAVAGGIVDNTSAYTALEAVLSDGDTVKFGPHKYLGSFVTDKAIKIDSHPNSELIQVNNKPLIKFTTNWANYAVLESEINPGATKFTLSGYVEVTKGMLITLWSNMWRDALNPVNFEVFKVLNVNYVEGGTEIYPERPVCSVQYGSILASLCVYPLKGVVLDLKGKVTNLTDHWERCIWLDGIDELEVRALKTSGTKGHALSIDRCYNVKINDDVEFTDPLSTASGAGYGLVFFRSTGLKVGKVRGRKMRHDIDFESCYDYSVEELVSVYPQSSPLGVSHNGYCGNATIGNITAYVSSPVDVIYGVFASSQGYKKLVGSVYEPDLEKRLKHPIRNLKIGKIKMIIDNTMTTSNTIVGAYLDTELKSPEVEEINLDFANSAVATGASASMGVMFNGYAELFKIGSIIANSVAQIANIRNMKGSQKVGSVIIDAIDVGIANYGVYTTGNMIDVKSFRYDRIIRNIAIECADNIVLGGVNTTFASVEKIGQRYGANTAFLATPISASFNLQSGKCEAQAIQIGSSISVSEGTTLSSREVLTRNGVLVLAAPASSVIATINVNMAPTAFYNGQTATICNGNAGATDRSQVILTGPDMATNVTIASGQVVNLVSLAGKWRLR